VAELKARGRDVTAERLEGPTTASASSLERGDAARGEGSRFFF
jgi:hypothetical protein